MVVSSSLHVLVACAACMDPSAKEASSSTSETSRSISRTEIWNMKKAANPSLYNYPGYLNPSLCMKNFQRLVEEKLNRLGKVGDAMRSWIDVLDEYERESPSDYASFILYNNEQLPYSLRTKLESSLNQISSINPVGAEYLRLAYFEGSGVCGDLSEGILHHIAYLVMGTITHDHNTHIYQVSGVQKWGNLTTALTLYEYQGSKYALFNRTNNCTKPLYEIPDQFVYTSCLTPNTDFSRLIKISWCVISTDYAEELRQPIVKLSLNYNYIYCVP